MPTFAYTARRPGAGVTADQIEADNRQEAVTRLKRRGLFILSLEAAGGAGAMSAGRTGLGRRVHREEVAVFTSQLASLLRAGLPLASTLRSLCQQMKGTVLAEVIEKLERDVSESTTLSESMARHPRVFPRTYTAAIHAGEEGGMLAEVVGRLSRNLKKDIEVRGRIRGALAYPVFLCVLGALTLTALLLFVIPRFTKLFATMGEQLPMPTRILLEFSGTMDRYWPFVLGGLIAMIAGCVAAARRETVREVADGWVLRLPYIGAIVRRSEIARFARTLAELLNSGVPILSGLQIARGVMSNRRFTAAIEIIRNRVAKGDPVASVLGQLEVFTPLVVNMAAVGEQSGQLPELLTEVADIYEKECERAIQAFTTILGPAMIVILGGVIAFVIAAILLPVFQASTLAN